MRLDALLGLFSLAASLNPTILAKPQLLTTNADDTNRDTVSRQSVLKRMSIAHLLKEQIQETKHEREYTGSRFTFFDDGFGACGIQNSRNDFVSEL